MARNIELRCQAIINYSKAGGKSIELKMNCDSCPEINRLMWVSSSGRKNSRASATGFAAGAIEKYCLVFRILKNAGKRPKADKSFHPQLP